MKNKVLLFLVAGIFQFDAFAQQPANGPTAPNIASTAAKADLAWRMGGNEWVFGDAVNRRNIFGFGNGNSPIYTQTDGRMRSKLNGSFVGGTQYFINTFGPLQGVNTSGYMLLGTDFGVGLTSFYNQRGAYSLLHLNGPNGTFIQDGGYRPWMQTGITFTDNQDRAYIGYRANSIDVSDFVINWSDNSVGPFPGPDNLIFNFSAGIGNNPGGIDGNQIEGRDVMKLTGYGNVGIGPRFNNTQNPGAGTMGQPQSLLHLSNNLNWSAWLQIGNESTGGAVQNGMRLGIVGSIQNTANPLFIANNFGGLPNAVGIGMLYNQQDRPLLFSTGYATDAFTGANTTNERIRIQSLGTITQIAGGTYAAYNPGGLNNRFTRVSISHDPLNPVTRPLSLMHLGYNATNATNDGWRSWMDVGTFISQSSDNMYVGLRNVGNNRSDAIINWGNEATTFLGAGPDRLRFIFTSNNGIAGLAGTNDGLEIMQMISTPTGSEGRVGIGSFNLLGIDPQNTLHINSPDPNATTTAGGRSGLRFQDLNTTSTPIVNPGNGVLSVDANGDVVYVQKSDGFGNYCGAANPTSLTGNYDVNMANNSIYFRNGLNFMVGEVNCGNVAPARFYLRYSNPLYYPATTEGMRVETNLPTTNVTAHFNNISGIGLGLRVNGNSFFNGSGVATGTWTPSDSNLKQNILPLNYSTSILNSLNPVSFYFDTLNSSLNFSSQKQYGFIAQQVESFLPELVQNFIIPAEYDSTGAVIVPEKTIKTMNYNGLFALLTRGFQEQQRTIDSLAQLTTRQDSLNKSYQEQINSLYSLITECCKNRSMENSSEKPEWKNATNIELSDAPSIVLDQNVPNPFAEQTTISFMLPETVKKAQLLFYNAEGKLIRALDLSQRGKGQINVFANDLSSGIYTYTLIADGEIVATKKMVKQ